MKIEAYCDGGSRGNPGRSAAAFVIYKDGKEFIAEYRKLSNNRTNNFAEYVGLVELLYTLSANDLTEVDIYCDSQLVVNQIKGTWKVKHDELKPLHATAYFLYIKGKHRLHHIKGHSGIKGNERADQLVNECLNRFKD